jgi:hypothetical protein
MQPSRQPLRLRGQLLVSEPGAPSMIFRFLGFFLVVAGVAITLFMLRRGPIVGPSAIMWEAVPLLITASTVVGVCLLVLGAPGGTSPVAGP